MAVFVVINKTGSKVFWNIDEAIAYARARNREAEK